MSGTKTNVSDINIKEDKIIMEDLNPIKHHLTESVWTLLNEEGEVVSQHVSSLKSCEFICSICRQQQCKCYECNISTMENIVMCDMYNNWFHW